MIDFTCIRIAIKDLLVASGSPLQAWIDALEQKTLKIYLGINTENPPNIQESWPVIFYHRAEKLAESTQIEETIRIFLTAAVIEDSAVEYIESVENGISVFEGKGPRLIESFSNAIKNTLVHQKQKNYYVKAVAVSEITEEFYPIHAAFIEVDLQVFNSRE